MACETNPTVDLSGIRTRNASMKHQLELIKRFARLSTPVLIQGETGTGKELVARALHGLSTRAGKPFVVVDCAAVPETLIESELFGHERGSFTGADRSYGGRIEAASGGTLFIDEVNSLSLPAQARLLRFLESGAFSRVGRQQPVSVAVRIVSASNIPLEELVAAGRMRADFYYRLNVLRIAIPPLRERLDDVPLLVRQALEEDEVARATGITEVSDEVMRELGSRSWPGNVRELRNAMRRAVALAASGPVLQSLDLSREQPAASVAVEAMRPWTGSFRAWIVEREREYLEELLRRYGSVHQQAAASGLPERTLYRKIRNLRLNPTAAVESVAPAVPLRY
jgi:two-component system response regulator HydG